MEELGKIKGGLCRNFARRALIAQDDPFWGQSNSPWKVVLEHPLHPAESSGPDYWLDRVLDLCESEITHQYFGLTFNDLMQMDPATFTKIEKRVHDLARRQSERMSPELKKELQKQ